MGSMMQIQSDDDSDWDDATAILSEPALSEWDYPEEEAAWADLQEDPQLDG